MMKEEDPKEPDGASGVEQQVANSEGGVIPTDRGLVHVVATQTM